MDEFDLILSLEQALVRMQEVGARVKFLMQQHKDKRHEEKQQLPIVEDEEKFETFSCSKDKDLIFEVSREEAVVPNVDVHKSLVQKRQFASDVRRLFASDYGATPKPSTQMTQKRSASYAETTQIT